MNKYHVLLGSDLRQVMRILDEFEEDAAIFLEQAHEVAYRKDAMIKLKSGLSVAMHSDNWEGAVGLAQILAVDMKKLNEELDNLAAFEQRLQPDGDALQFVKNNWWRITVLTDPPQYS